MDATRKIEGSRNPLEGWVLAEKYRLDRELAVGGMGELWLGLDLTLQRPVAIKLLRVVVDRSTVRIRFEREAQAAACMRSAHIVHTYDYGVDRGVPFIVMEYLEGEDLGARLARLPKMAPRDATLILRQLCKALDVIHGAGIVHRDIKPGNIFLAMDGGEETVKIFDFGIAKATSGRFRKISRMGTVIGTPRYMSPEQVRGEAHVDHRSDLWSAAVILYKMLVGHFPFNGASTVDLMNNICQGRSPRASELAPELPAAIDDFFAKALSRDPEQRFQSGKQMADALLSVMHELAPGPAPEHLDDEERPTVPMSPRSDEEPTRRSNPDADTVRLMKPVPPLKPVTLMRRVRTAFSAVAATLALVVFLQYAGLGCQGGSSIDPEAAARHGHRGEPKATGGVD